MSEFMHPTPMMRTDWDMRPSVTRDLDDLAHQMDLCHRGDHQRFRFQHGLSRTLCFLRQHLVSIVVLLSLAAAGISAM